MFKLVTQICCTDQQKTAWSDSDMALQLNATFNSTPKVGIYNFLLVKVEEQNGFSILLMYHPFFEVQT